MRKYSSSWNPATRYLTETTHRTPVPTPKLQYFSAHCIDHPVVAFNKRIDRYPDGTMCRPSGENAAGMPEFECPVNEPASVSPVVAFHTRNDCSTMLNRALSRNGGLKRHVLQGIKVL